MCGRFLSTATGGELATFFDAEPPDVEIGARYNVAPTNDIYGVTARPDGRRVVEVFEWGLIPSWAKDSRIGNSLINCRAETIAEKPSVR
ncbi:MAG: SOS response-associated peptidase, partial [Ilumatobacteraceae bacterium]